MPTIIQKHLLQSFRRVLKPFVKLLVRAGVQYGEFAEIVKSVYVDAAAHAGLENATRPSPARIAMSTGIPLRDVDRIIDNEDARSHATPSIGGVMGEVLKTWFTDPRYIGPYGIPLELEFDAPPGTRSFTHLVSLVAPNVAAQDVLGELLRVGSVAYSGGTYLRATSRSFVMPFGVSSEELEYFVNTMSLLATTLEYNLDRRNEAKRLERFVLADRGLTPENLAKFETYVRQQAGNFLLDLDNWLSPYAPTDVLDAEPRTQTGVHVFMFIDQPTHEPPLSHLLRDPPGDIRR
jgi:hypothetical protein